MIATDLREAARQWMLIAAGVVMSLILSEATSNTASANVMVPMMIAVAQQSGLPVLPVVLATGLACSLGLPRYQDFVFGHLRFA